MIGLLAITHIFNSNYLWKFLKLRKLFHLRLYVGLNKNEFITKFLFMTYFYKF